VILELCDERLVIEALRHNTKLIYIFGDTNMGQKKATVTYTAPVGEAKTLDIGGTTLVRGSCGWAGAVVRAAGSATRGSGIAALGKVGMGAVDGGVLSVGMVEVSADATTGADVARLDVAVGPHHRRRSGRDSSASACLGPLWNLRPTPEGSWRKHTRSWLFHRSEPESASQHGGHLTTTSLGG
jgi:hypothetical protein